MTINLERLREYPIVAPDCETTGLHWYKDKVFGIALSAWDGERIHSDYWDIRENPRIVTVLAREIPHCKRVINHNMKFDAHFLREAGIRVPLDRIECTSVRAALIDENEDSFSLDALGLKYVGMGKNADIYEQLAALFGGAPTKAVQMKNLHRAPSRIAKGYAIVDPEIAIRLWLWQEKEIEKQELQKVWDLERRLMPVLIDIEHEGIRVDEERASASRIELAKTIKKAQLALDEIAGKEVNANSPPQMRALFGVHEVKNGDRTEWRTDKGFLLETTDGGAGSLGKKSLAIMEEQGDERAKAVMTLRKMTKADQFLKDHILGHAHKGRVFPNYNQTRGDNDLGTGTGRFSIDDPAMQQIPARDKDIAAVVRPCFLPEKGGSWGCGDWAQFEFRWFAHYTKDANILAAYARDPNTDYHAIVSQITGIPRNARFAGDANAKQINLGLVFGMGRGELAYQMGLDYTLTRDRNGREWKKPGSKANEIFDTYHSAIPGVQKLLDEAASIARSRGYIKTVMERHIRFPGGKFTHKAGGLVFQGSSADCIKQKMVELHPIMKKEGASIKISIHDELDFSFPAKHAKRLAALAKKHLECFDGVGCPISCRVPILSSVAIGSNWFEAWDNT